MIKADLLKSGDLCSFTTSPFFPGFSAPQTGRYAVLKVLTKDDLIGYLVLDGIFGLQPALYQAESLPPLYQERFTNFSNTPALGSTRRDWDIDLLEFAVLGNAPVSAAELALIPQFLPFSTFQNASSMAEREWRWRRDREALTQEHALYVAARQAKREAERERYETRLKHLSWEVLLAEKMFVRWSPSPPFPPIGFTDAVRAEFRNAILELQSIPPKPNKKDTRRVLRTLVNQINSLDERHGNVVETEEREDLCTALEEVTFVAKHRELAEEVDSWRSW